MARQLIASLRESLQMAFHALRSVEDRVCAVSTVFNEFLDIKWHEKGEALEPRKLSACAMCRRFLTKV